MTLKRVLGALCAFALLLCANLRCVYSVKAAGEELPGFWTRAEIEAASAAALAAAEEVSRAESALPELELHPALRLEKHFRFSLFRSDDGEIFV